MIKYSTFLEKIFIVHPWLFGLMVILGSALAILLIIVSFSSFRQGEFYQLNSTQSETIKKVETAEEKSDRLAIMNLLNRFSRDGNDIPSEATLDEITNLKIEQIDQVRDRLERITVEKELVPAQQDLVTLFTRWEYYLSNDKDTRDLRNEFKSIAERYTWLDALMWIIILNRL